MIPNTIQIEKANKRISTGLQCSDGFAENPLISFLLFLIFSLIFGVLAYYVQQKGVLVQWDIAMVNRMHETALSSSPWIKNIILAGYYIGLQGYMAIGFFLALYFVFKKFWKEFFMVVILFARQSILFYFLTKYFARPQPVFTEQIGAIIVYPRFGFLQFCFDGE